MPVPDVIGEEWNKAKEIFSHTSYHLKMVLTNPPWAGKGQGKLRVIRQRYSEKEEVELVVSYDIYLKE